MQAVHYRFKTIYIPAHALEFVTDPSFFDMRANLTGEYKAAFLELGQGSLLQQCWKAFEMCPRGDQELNEKLHEEFATFTATLHVPASFFIMTRKLNPALSWAQVDSREYQNLAPTLVQIHGNPSGAVGAERNHKTGKRVLLKLRVRRKRSSVERQVAILFNSSQLERKFSKKRSDKFVDYLATIASSGTDRQETETDSEDEVLEEVFRGDDDASGAFLLEPYFEEDVTEVSVVS
jgi:hypothetical protein